MDCTTSLKRIQQASPLMGACWPLVCFGLGMMINETSAANASLAPLNLWLVDDNASIRSLLSDLLQSNGSIHCSRQFSSAEAVLGALAENKPPQAILMDI